MQINVAGRPVAYGRRAKRVPGGVGFAASLAASVNQEERQMSPLKGKILGVVVACGVLGTAAGLLTPAVGAESQPAAISNEALVALARMGKSLQGKQFSYESRQYRATAGPNNELLHIFHLNKVLVQRPDRIALDSDGDDGEVKLLYDGKSIVVYSVEAKQYATIPVTGGITSALDIAAERTGTELPLASLLAEDPEKSVLNGIIMGGKVGTATIRGVRCDHFFFVQASDDLELELWLEDNERSLPRRVVVTYRALAGRPVFIAEISAWNFSPDVADSNFEFSPPAGVTQVALQQAAPPPSQK
jgi:hypothetical protein